jgi:hypothetical protein
MPLALLALAWASACERPLDGAPCDCIGEPCSCANGYVCCANQTCHAACSLAIAVPLCEPSPSLDVYGEWCWANPQPHGRQLLDIWGVQKNDIWVVGEHGNVLRWNGETWTEVPSPTTAGIRRIWGASSTEWWGASSQGLLHWKDEHWIPERQDIDVADVWGAAPDDVWVLTKRPELLRGNSDGWKTQPLPPDAAQLTRIWGTDSTHVWLVGENVFAWNGREWSDVEVDSAICGDHLEIPWNQIAGRSADDVWLARYDTQCTLHREGGTWLVYNDRKLRRLSQMPNDEDVVALDDAGQFLRWNGSYWGWPVTYNRDPISINALWFDGDEVVTVGGAASINQWSAMGWHEYSPYHALARDELNAVHGVSRSNVLSVGGKGAILHFDGKSWKPEASTTTKDLRSVWAREADDVWAVGENGAILHRDSKRWTHLEASRNPAPNADLRAVWASAPDDAWAVGLDGVVLRFDGSDWRPFESPGPMNLLGVWGTAPSDVWVVGGTHEDGPVETANMFHWGGMGWTSARFLKTAEADVVDFLEASNSWTRCMKYDRFADPLGAVAISGRASDDVWITTRCSGAAHWDGTNWSRRLGLLNDHDIRGIWSAGNSVWTVGNWGEIRTFTDETWTNETSISESATPRINAVWGADPGEVWAVGADGIILRHRFPAGEAAER